MDVTLLADGLGFTEGPILLPGNRIGVVSMSRGSVLVLGLDGVLETEHHVGGGPNGLALGPDGDLHIAQNGGIWSAESKAQPGVQVIRDGQVSYIATGMDAPNDLVFGPDGRLWVTDSREEVDFANPDGALPGRVWAVDVATGESELQIEGPVFVNGLAFSGDGRTLYLTATVSGEITKYDVAQSASWNKQGPPLNERVLHTVRDGHPDGLAVDEAGRLWIATTSGDCIDIVSADGALEGSIGLPPGSMPTNICRGPEADFYVTAAKSGAVLRLS